MTPESSTKSELELEAAWRSWQRLVTDDSFQQFRSVLTSFRWELLEGLVQAGSNHEKAAELRGAVTMLDHILKGGLDETARELLGLPEKPRKPLQPYMPEEEEA